jgi:hypothetical protein
LSSHADASQAEASLQAWQTSGQGPTNGEYARQNGHADLIRERVDGQAGE